MGSPQQHRRSQSVKNMKRNEIKKLFEQSIDELAVKVAELNKELARARLEKIAGRLNDTTKVVRLADDLARVKTVLREKNLSGNLPQATVKSSKQEKKEKTN